MSPPSMTGEGTSRHFTLKRVRNSEASPSRLSSQAEWARATTLRFPHCGLLSCQNSTCPTQSRHTYSPVWSVCFGLADSPRWPMPWELKHEFQDPLNAVFMNPNPWSVRVLLPWFSCLLVSALMSPLARPTHFFCVADGLFRLSSLWFV